MAKTTAAERRFLEVPMIMSFLFPDNVRSKWCAGFPFLAAVLAVSAAGAAGQEAGKIETLRIGTSGSLALGAAGDPKEPAQDTLKNFIKTETGFDNEIIRQKNWTELAEKLAKGQLHLGVFQGYEFAWAQEKYPELRPLTIAVNVYPYRHACVLVRQDNKAADFAGLQGQSCALPSAQAYIRLFVERQCQANGKPVAKFFSQVAAPDNSEDALDDVVDGVVQAVVVDRVGLEAFQHRKPGRFGRLKEVLRSQAFPAPLVAFANEKLDEETRQRFQDGLINARKTDKGKNLLTYFKLTGFEAPPGDLGHVLAETRKAYPRPSDEAK